MTFELGVYTFGKTPRTSAGGYGPTAHERHRDRSASTRVPATRALLPVPPRQPVNRPGGLVAGGALSCAGSPAGGHQTIRPGSEIA